MDRSIISFASLSSIVISATMSRCFLVPSFTRNSCAKFAVSPFIPSLLRVIQLILSVSRFLASLSNESRDVSRYQSLSSSSTTLSNESRTRGASVPLPFVFLPSVLSFAKIFFLVRGSCRDNFASHQRFSRFSPLAAGNAPSILAARLAFFDRRNHYDRLGFVAAA